MVQETEVRKLKCLGKQHPCLKSVKDVFKKKNAIHFFFIMANVNTAKQDAIFLNK